MQEFITVRGARQHNLKNINVKIPKNKLVVITGISGSGKSTLAFDTLYAEGQRRYIESLSSYARQFLGVMQKPEVDSIEGLSPAIAIDQKSISHNPRSTVGTTTEIYDYLRLLFARIGRAHCPSCGKELKRQTVPQIVDVIFSLADKKPITVLLLAPIVRGKKGEYKQVLDVLRKRGFTRARIDKEIYRLDELPPISKTKRHDIEIVVDRINIPKGFKYTTNTNSPEDYTLKQRITDSVETALEIGGGDLIVQINPLKLKSEEIILSEKLWCHNCNRGFPEIQPNTFSFNSPYGACPKCNGLGFLWQVDPQLVYNPDLSISEGGLLPYSNNTDPNSWHMRVISAVAEDYEFDLDVPLGALNKTQLDALLYGVPGNIYVKVKKGYWRTRYEGVIPRLERLYRETKSENMREEIEQFMRRLPCNLCHGTRLKEEATAVKIDKKNIFEVCNITIKELKKWIESLIKVSKEKEEKNSAISRFERIVADQILKEIDTRLNFLLEVGLEYLTLNRETRTLAGGEGQRIRLASQIGSGLVGVLYVLDEPSIGLHPRDIARLIATLKKLRDLGNTVIVVEHDEETIKSADWVIDLGPGGGINGGSVVASGPLSTIINCKRSITGQFLKGEKKVGEKISKGERNGQKGEIVVLGAQEHNLKNINVKFPLGKFICVTGVSGSGKSSLVMDILYNALSNKFNMIKLPEGKHKKILGTENIDKVINIDQSPIGRTPRSNPATYVGFFTKIRELFAETREAKMRGYTPSRFSFNLRGGRCESCEGEGVKRIEMQFLPDVYVTCDVCQGKRYTRETLEIQYKGKNIYEVLEMTVSEAKQFFSNVPPIKHDLDLLEKVGLDYIKIGQPAPTLSGGEAQRVKLAAELKKRATGKTVYILDEPTTGLHFYDIHKLLVVLHKLVDYGNTVIVIEHNLDVIKTADWIIDLGPEGGKEGGYVVYQGPLDGILKSKESYTGRFLHRKIFKREDKKTICTKTTHLLNRV
uniref:UvrABC system protein A n=1 Tax=candidate division CPR3 bacterium TaxID=2268181 RepID=A0A7C5UW68_UNCC3